MSEHLIQLLLVEDENVDQVNFRRLINKDKLPYEMVLTETVEDALQALETYDFDIMIVDYNLSDGTAMDILQINETVPAIVITGTGDEQIAVEALRAGAYDYVCKDISGHYLSVLPQIIRNTLERKKTNDELKAYQERLEQMVEERTLEVLQERERLMVTISDLSDAVIAVDTRGYITLFNHAAERLSGYSQSEALYQCAKDLFCIRNAKYPNHPCRTPLCRVLMTGRPHTGNPWDILLGKGGNEQPVSAVATPIFGANKIMIGAVMVLRDESKAREIDQLKEEFLATISHELRTPLSIIMGAVKLLLDKAVGKVNSDQEEVLETAKKNIKRLSSIVDSLLDISKLEASQMIVSPELTSIHAIIQQTVNEFQEQALHKSIDLQYDLQEDCMLDIDANKIGKVLEHLISNSIRFTPEQGKVVVMGSVTENEFTITVQDTGIGINEKDLPKLFHTFVQIGRQPGPGERGTGLGLAIAKGIIEKHNGRIWIESREGEGTNVSFSLPLSKAMIHAYYI